MKRIVLSVMIFAPVVGFSQAGFDEELNKEIDTIYAANGWQQQGVQQVGGERVIEARNSQGGLAQQGERILIVNQAQPSTQAANTQITQPQITLRPVQQTTQVQQPIQIQQPVQQIQQQPTTVIQANPLTESRADKLRRERQNLELQTELKIVEKLESSRMEDEKRRAGLLFGDKFESLDKSSAPQTEVVDVEESSQADIKGEIQEAVAQLKADLGEKEKAPEKSKSDYFVAIQAGVLEYPDAFNVETRGSLGFSVGMQQKRLVLEGLFSYADYEVEDLNQFNPTFFPRVTGVDHYALGISGKYQILSGLIRPFVGAGLSYNYREFIEVQGFTTFDQETSSQAIDVAAIAGVDLAFSDDFSIGMDFRYSTNITNWNDNDFSDSFFGGSETTPIEEIDYYVLSLTGRFTF